ncbi:MAG: SpoIIE family protein phosphatase [Planctomycetota bacterium]|jgi:serine phosphatase RsbU (regulator of sigma subunit)/pSer/pThr/pTyr-binding forkhead associated (FHA) protein
MAFIGYSVADTGYTLRELRSETLLIGRGRDCDVTVPSPRISRHHLRITRRGDDYFVEDLNSRNGSSLNGQLLQREEQLSDRDSFDVDDVGFTFYAGDQPPGSTDTVYSFVLESETMMSDGQLATLRLDAVNGISRRLSEARTHDEALHAFAIALFSLFPQAMHGSIVVQQARSDVIIRLRRTEHTSADGPDTDDYIRACDLVSEVMAVSRALRLEVGDSADDLEAAEDETILAEPSRPVMAAPISGTRGRSLGAVVLEFDESSAPSSDQDLSVLTAVASLAGRTLEVLNLSVEHDDLRDAERIQASLLPDAPPEISGFDLHHFYLAARHIGGDYFDYVPLDEHRTAVALGDVAGKGAAAALLMSRLNSAVRLTLEVSQDPVSVVETLNRLFYDSSAVGKFVTFLLVILDSRTHTMTAVCAGHCPAIIGQPSGTCEFPVHKSVCLPLGVRPDAEFRAQQITLEPGDTAALFTDGLIEARNNDRELFGLQRVEQCLAARPATAKQAVENLRERAVAFSETHDFADDVCILAIRRC